MYVGERVWPPRPPTLDEVRSEFDGGVPRLVDSASAELAAVGTIRRDAVLSAVSISYFDLRIEKPLPIAEPPADAPPWLQDWMRRQHHPLFEGVVRVWGPDEFAGTPPSSAEMLALVTGQTARAVGVAVVVDGVPVSGHAADSSSVLNRSALIDGGVVSVSIDRGLSDDPPLLTTR